MEVTPSDIEDGVDTREEVCWVVLRLGPNEFVGGNVVAKYPTKEEAERSAQDINLPGEIYIQRRVIRTEIHRKVTSDNMVPVVRNPIRSVNANSSTKILTITINSGMTNETTKKALDSAIMDIYRSYCGRYYMRLVDLYQQ